MLNRGSLYRVMNSALYAWLAWSVDESTRMDGTEAQVSHVNLVVESGVQE